MNLELLYFDGCPTYKTAGKTLKEVLKEEGIEAELQLVAVNTDEEAQKMKFPGSPTIRVDGQDLFPTAGQANWYLGCRVYVTPEGLKGSPTAQMIRAALRGFTAKSS